MDSRETLRLLEFVYGFAPPLDDQTLFQYSYRCDCAMADLPDREQLVVRAKLASSVAEGLTGAEASRARAKAKRLLRQKLGEYIVTDRAREALMEWVNRYWVDLSEEYGLTAPLEEDPLVLNMVVMRALSQLPEREYETIRFRFGFLMGRQVHSPEETAQYIKGCGRSLGMIVKGLTEKVLRDRLRIDLADPNRPRSDVLIQELEFPYAICKAFMREGVRTVADLRDFMQKAAQNPEREFEDINRIIHGIGSRPVLLRLCAWMMRGLEGNP